MSPPSSQPRSLSGRRFPAFVHNPALSGLTVRGRSFLAAGAATAGCAFALGQQDLLRVSVLLLALPLGCAGVLGRIRYSLALARVITPCRVVAGGTARVNLELENLSRRAARALLAEDKVPYSLGPAPRFWLTRLPGKRRVTITYSLRTELRGRYPVGPLRLRLTDPFGMCEVTRSFTAVDPLVVVPKIHPLKPLACDGSQEGTDASSSRALATASENDVLVREYRNGDDLRRVHWRSTARWGQLMVRQEEQSRHQRATILLDVRKEAHSGSGAHSSLEWAVVAAASVAAHLVEQRNWVRLVTDGRPTAWNTPSEGADRIIDDLAALVAGPAESLPAATQVALSENGRQTLVAILGHLDSTSAARLCARSSFSQAAGMAILLRTEQWVSSSPQETERHQQERSAAMDEFRARGWAVVEAGPADQVQQVWERAALCRGTFPSPGWGHGGQGCP